MIRKKRKGFSSTVSRKTKQREEHEDNLFGKIAVRLHFLTEDELEDCLTLQHKISSQTMMRLGDIMAKLGLITPKQIREILSHQLGLIVYCPTCDTQYNVVMFRPGAAIPCYGCGKKILTPERTLIPGKDIEVYFAQ